MKKSPILLAAGLLVPLLTPSAVTAVPRRVRVVAPRHAVVAPGRVYVRVGPPRTIVEVRPTRPSAAHVWIGGYHRWNGTAYVWVPGRWEIGPRPAAVWVSGHWAKSPEGWYWVEGYWR
jgi:hypothetical protein